MTTSAITLDRVTKRFGDVVAVNDLSLSVFIATVVAKPRLVILDEPFSGLDPVNAENLTEAILDLRRTGTTIVFSTHLMRTAETKPSIPSGRRPSRPR